MRSPSLRQFDQHVVKRVSMVFSHRGIMARLVLLFLVLLVCEVRAAFMVGPEMKVVANDGAANDWFGDSVAMSGINAIVGAYGDDDAGLDSGAAYIFSETILGMWAQVGKLVAGDAAAGDYFGYSVAMSGINAIIGAPYDDDAGFRSGSAYIFSETTPGTWTQIAKLVAVDAALDSTLGRSVAISGINAIVGADRDDDAGQNSGSVYIFSETSPDVWTQVSKVASGAAVSAYEEFFGYSVAMSGINAIVGAYWDDHGFYRSGSAFILSEATSGTWTQVAKLVADDGAYGDSFGVSVAMTGINAIVGAYRDEDAGYYSGSAYIFSETTPGTWTQLAKLVADDGAAHFVFGYSVSMSGINAIVGAWGEDNISGSYSYGIGAAYIFSETTPGVWTQVAKLEPGDGTSSDSFGKSVSMSDSTVIVGARKGDTDVIETTGAAYFFTFDSIDDCPGHLCEHGATCIDDVQSYVCNCPATWEGEFCEVGKCNNAVIYDGSDACDCTDSGAEGTWCEVDIDDCLSNPCMNGATCTDLGATFFPNHNNEFNCSCNGDYFGPTCSDTLCVSSPCLNNGTCVNGEDFACNCTTTNGYEGKFCETEIDECLSSPCLNQGICTDLLDNFTCDCTGTGFEGWTCQSYPLWEANMAVFLETYENVPIVNRPYNFTRYPNTVDILGTTYESLEFVLDFESTYALGDEVGSKLPQTHPVTGNSTHLNWVPPADVSMAPQTQYLYFCFYYIHDTFTGTNSTKGLLYLKVYPDVDDCLSNPCGNGAACLDTGANQFECDCENTGFEGKLCMNNIDECLSSPCLNDGICSDNIPNSFSCDCSMTGFMGSTCETVDNCASSPCLNDGTCLTDGGSSLFQCTCADGYTGSTCDIDCVSNPCECMANPCQNNGTCIVHRLDNALNGYKCQCPSTHFGMLCEALDEPTTYDHPPVTIIFSFSGFVDSDDAAELLAADLKQDLLPSTLGGAPSDFEVVIHQQSDGSYEVTIVFTNPYEYNDEDIEQLLLDLFDYIDRVDGDIKFEIIEEDDSSAYHHGPHLFWIGFISGMVYMLSSMMMY